MKNKSIDLSTYTPAASPELFMGKTYLISGASDGLGRALAMQLAKLGANLILTGKTTKKLEQLYDAIEEEKSEDLKDTRIAILPIDYETATEDAFAELAYIIAQEFQQLDCLLHFAASLGMHSTIVTTSPTEWNKSLRVNLNAPFLLTKFCYPLLNKAKQAQVVFCSDAVAKQGDAHWSSYSVCKAATDNLMQILAAEWQANTSINVNSVDPGIFESNFRRQAFPAEDSSKLTRVNNVVLPFIYLLDSAQSAKSTQSGKRYSWNAEINCMSES